MVSDRIPAGIQVSWEPALLLDRFSAVPALFVGLLAKGGKPQWLSRLRLAVAKALRRAPLPRATHSEALSVVGSNGVRGAVEDGRDSGIMLTNVSKRFALGKDESLLALENVNLTVSPHEFVTIIGPSGCGKSTLLRAVGSLEIPTEGSVTVGGRDPADLVADHGLGVAFQDHALLPWLSSWDNVALPFRVARRPVDKERIAELLALRQERR